MDPSTVTIPLTAWEQAVIVVLFVLFTLAIVQILIKNSTKNQMLWQDFIDEQNTKWQCRVQEQNAEWQRWISVRDAREVETMTKVIETLSKLGQKMDNHNDFVQSHFHETKEEIQKGSSIVIEAVRESHKPKSKK